MVPVYITVACFLVSEGASLETMTSDGITSLTVCPHEYRSLLQLFAKPERYTVELLKMGTLGPAIFLLYREVPSPFVDVSTIDLGAQSVSLVSFIGGCVTIILWVASHSHPV